MRLQHGLLFDDVSGDLGIVRPVPRPPAETGL